MRRFLVTLAAATMLAGGVSAAWGQSGGSGNNGSNSGSNSGPSVRIGPNAKLGADPNDVSVAARFDCRNSAKYTVQAKVRQGDALSKGTTTLTCEKGANKSFTVVTTDGDDEFVAGQQADACVAVTKKGSDAKPKPVCRKVNVVA